MLRRTSPPKLMLTELTIMTTIANPRRDGASMDAASSVNFLSGMGIQLTIR
jgi:hypothetical protein